MPNLELRKADILAGPVERGAFDLVTTRAVLHHIANPETAIANMIASLRAAGALLLIEPDFLPVSVAAPQEVRASGRGGLRGLANGELIITLDGHLPVDWPRLG